MSFPARYAGECGHCGEPILVGQMIAYRGEGYVEHITCPAPPEICGTCWLQKPCDCE